MERRYKYTPADERAGDGKKIGVKQAAQQMGVSDQFIRIGLQRNILPFGYAVKMSRWVYYINPVLFENYIKKTASPVAPGSAVSKERTLNNDTTV